MKVLIIQPRIFCRGAEVVSLNQAYWLNRRGHQARIATLFVDWKRLPEVAKKVDYLLPPQILANLCQNQPLFLLIFGPWLLLWVTLRGVREAEVLNPHNPPSAWVAVVLGKIFKKTVVWTAHNVPRSVPWKKKRSLFEYLAFKVAASQIDAVLVRKVDLVVAVCKKVKGLVKRRYQKEAVVVYPGVSETGGKADGLPEEVKKLRKKSDLLLLQVGVLHRQKRQELSLGAVARLNREGVKAGLILVGEGPDEKKLKIKSEKLNIKDRVFFAGFVLPSQLGAYYKSCDLNLLPSVDESFPATPLEALSHGKVSVVTRDCGVMEMIAEFAITTLPETEELVKRIVDFKRRRVFWEKKGKTGQEFLKKNLGWKKFVEGFVKAVEELEPRQVPAIIYNKKYFRSHHECPVKALRKERETKLKRVMELIEVVPGLRVLDLGCGNGELSMKLAKFGAKVWGIDYSSVAIVLATKRKREAPRQIAERVNFSVMDAASLEFPASFFDRIVCLDVWEHLYPKMLDQVVKETLRVIKPGGLMVIETAPNAWLHKPIIWTAKKLLRSQGFESEEYHVNLFNYFKFKRLLHQLPGRVRVDLFNDGRWAFSSRLERMKRVPSWTKQAARVFDWLRENTVSERIILATPLKIFLAYDLWGVVEVEKK